jgi:hypothetical protein
LFDTLTLSGPFVLNAYVIMYVVPLHLNVVSL